MLIKDSKTEKQQQRFKDCSVLRTASVSFFCATLRYSDHLKWTLGCVEVARPFKQSPCGGIDHRTWVTFLISVSACVHVYVCGCCVHVCTCVWKLEFNLSVTLRLLSRVFWDRVPSLGWSPRWTGDCQLCELGGEWAPGIHLFLPALLSWN